MEINLSHRLQEVASFIPKGSKLLDVGSDHAYLPLYLLEQQIITAAIAGEVVKGPFESAQHNIAQTDYADQIEARLASGLDAMEASDQVNVITICGMGGRLISNILEAGKSKLEKIDRLVLQPNNREDELRQWLCENNLRIVAEKIVYENDKFYEIIVVEPGEMRLNETECRFGPFLAKEKSPHFMAKWQRESEKWQQALACVPLENKDDRSAILQKIETIKEMIQYES